MCQAPDTIDRRLCRVARKWVTIVTACKAHGQTTRWCCYRDGSRGIYRTHRGPWMILGTASWPPAVQSALQDILKPAPKRAKPKRTKREQSQIAASKLLAQWQRRLKLAQTKVKKYKAAVRRYERENMRAPIAYARHENHGQGQEVRVYRDSACTDVMARFTRSTTILPLRPPKGSPYRTINGVVYRLEWRDGHVGESPLPHDIDHLFQPPPTPESK